MEFHWVNVTRYGEDYAFHGRLSSFSLLFKRSPRWLVYTTLAPCYVEETRSGEMMCDPGVDEMRVRTKGVSRRSAPREANRLAFPSFLRLSKYLSAMQLGAPCLSDASITRGCFDTSATCCPNVLLSRLLGYGNVFVARSMRGSPCRMPDSLVCSMLVTIAVATVFFFFCLYRQASPSALIAR